ncbi:MAG: hypothetical protein AAF740_15090 [Bacteroidota bacterium]
MKKFLLFFAFATLLGFTSCSDDEEELPPTSSEIITANVWAVESSAVEIQVLTETFGDTLGLLDGFERTTLQFDQDGTLEIVNTETGDREFGTWAFLNNDTEIRFSGIITDEETEGLEGFELSEEQIAALQTFTVNELTATRLAIENENEITVELPDVPIPIPVTVRLNLTFIPEM